jgi:uncharacterized protein
MKKIIFISLLFISLSALAQVEYPCFVRYIDVTGTAEMAIVPDRIVLRIILSEAENKDKVSLSRLEKQLLATIENLKIPLSNLRVDDAASFFHKGFFTGKNIYSQKTYELQVDNAASIGKVLEALEKVSISNISIKNIDHSKIEEYKKQVKIDATKSAKNKAQYMLAAVEEEIGKTIYIKEIETFYQLPEYANMRTNMVNNEEDYEIGFKKIEIKYSVNVRFEIK